MKTRSGGPENFELDVEIDVGYNAGQGAAIVHPGLIRRQKERNLLEPLLGLL